MALNRINGREVLSVDEIILRGQSVPAISIVASSDATDVEKAQANFICDGVNDQIIINEALSKSIRVLLVGPTFTISDTIVLQTGQELAGFGISDTAVYWRNPVSGNTGIMVKAGADSSIENLRLHGYPADADEDTTENVDTIVLLEDSAPRIAIKGCRFINAQRYFVKSEVSANNQLAIKNCLFLAHGNSGKDHSGSSDGFFNILEVNDFVFSENSITISPNGSTTTGSTLYLQNPKQLEVANNKFILDSSGGQVSHTIHVNTGDIVNITGNQFENLDTISFGSSFHIRVASVSKLVVSNNSIEANGNSTRMNGQINLNGCAHVVCDANVIKGATDSWPSGCIRLTNTQNFTCSNNNVEVVQHRDAGSGARGILAEASSASGAITGNQIFMTSNDDGAGILLFDSDNIAVVGNSVEAGTGVGIDIAGGTSTGNLDDANLTY